jgi:Uma2 family endonuclease
MNEHFRRSSRPDAPVATQAAEGLPRRCWTVEEIEAIVEAGIISPDERFELIGGEAVPMSPKGYRHEWVKAALNKFWVLSLPEGLTVIPETTLRLDPWTYVEPDFLFYREDTGLEGVTGEKALLAIEVADTSLAYETGRKATVYAAFGLRELWVVDANSLVTTVFREPREGGYAPVTEVDPATDLRPLFAPDLGCRIGDLRLACGLPVRPALFTSAVRLS